MGDISVSTGNGERQGRSLFNLLPDSYEWFSLHSDDPHVADSQGIYLRFEVLRKVPMFIVSHPL